MEFYIFRAASNTPETGPVYPQVQKMSAGYDYDSKNSVHALSREVKEIPAYEPNLDHFILHNKAKLTDLLSVSVIYGGFLISPRLKAILQGFQLPTKHKFYLARVLYKKKFYEYYWFHFISDFSNFIDYPKSRFKIYFNYTHKLDSVEIHSKEELATKKQKLKADNPGKTVTIWAESLHMKETFDKQIDLFSIANFDSHVYISASLRIAIDNQQITGCDISPALNLTV